MLTVRCFVETAGQTESLTDTPENWREILSDPETADSLYFGGEASDDTHIKAAPIPSVGEQLAPVFRVTKHSDQSDETILVPNYGKSGAAGRYVFAVQFSGDGVLVDRPRLEAWDSQDDVDLLTPPTHEVLVGTEKNLSRSMIRAYDTTSLIGSEEITSPANNWWTASTSSTGSENNKLLMGETSFLIAQQDLLIGDVWYLALACIVPSDALRGMSGHRFVLSVRAFHADE